MCVCYRYLDGSPKCLWGLANRLVFLRRTSFRKTPSSITVKHDEHDTTFWAYMEMYPHNHLDLTFSFNSIISWGIEIVLNSSEQNGKFSWETAPNCSFCACVNQSFWNFVRVNRTIAMHSQTTFKFSG